LVVGVGFEPTTFRLWGWILHTLSRCNHWKLLIRCATHVPFTTFWRL